MTSFREREQAFEAKFRQDEELRFKVTSRRNKLLGLWAAERMGLSADDAEAYAKAVIRSDFEKPGDEDVLAKVHGDLTRAGVTLSERLLRKRMDELLEEAKQQFTTGAG